MLLFKPEVELTKPHKDPVDLEFIFMPEGKCARCGIVPPVLYKEFVYADGTISLGFCQNKCLSKFVQEMIALQRAVENHKTK